MSSTSKLCTRPYKFERCEKVLCFHGPLIYEAKIVNLRKSVKDCEYFVHYAGWNKSWDEWVSETRVLKHNEANLQKQKDLYKSYRSEPVPKKKKVFCGKKEKPVQNDDENNPIWGETRLRFRSGESSSQDSSSDPPSLKKIKMDPSIETEKQFLSKVEIKIKIPDEMKLILTDDWENINVLKKFIKLPAKVNVNKIFDGFIKSKGQYKNKEKSRIEVVNGLKNYFNKMLLNQLLYGSERDIYLAETKKINDSEPENLCGVIHLSRFFVRLGGALAYTNLTEKKVQMLTVHLQELFKYIQKNLTNFYNVKQDYTTKSATD